MNYYLCAKKNGTVRCGTSDQLLINDLKTVRGIGNRYSVWINNHKEAGKQVELYTYTNVYDDSTFHLVKTF